MSRSSDRALLRVPLERLQRRDPERSWRVGVAPTTLRGEPADGGNDESTAAAMPLQVADVAVRADALVEIDVELTTVAEGVMVTGSVSSGWQGPCSRCLRDLDGTTDAAIQELFELSPTEGESYPLGEEFLDLTPMVRDAVLLELPLLAPCPEPEPCPHAPDELSTGDGDEDDADAGAEPKLDPRWAALSELRFDED